MKSDIHVFSGKSVKTPVMCDPNLGDPDPVEAMDFPSSEFLDLGEPMVYQPPKPKQFTNVGRQTESLTQVIN